MNECLESFQKIVQSTEQLSKGQLHPLESVEMKKIAASLQESVLPCVVEMKVSANRLKELVQDCFKQLDQADDIWRSKRRISEVSKSEIWQDLGELSGCYVRIQEINSRSKQAAIQKNQEAWLKRLEALRVKYFVDSNGKLKEGIGWDDKKDFLSKINSTLTTQSKEFDQSIVLELAPILRELKIVNFKTMQFYFELLNSQTTKVEKLKLNQSLEKISKSFQDTKTLENQYFVSLENWLQPTIEAWKNRWGDIGWKYVAVFRDEVSTEIEKRITLLFDDRTELAKKFLEEAIASYNRLLELQGIYRQELPEQQSTEKAWIEQQRNELEQIQAKISLILDN